MKDFEKYLPWVVAGVVVYFAWQKLSQTGDKIGKSIADQIIALFGLDKTDVDITAGFVFPDGSILDADNVAQVGTQYWENNTLFLSIAGNTYKVTGRNAQNNYVLVKT